MLLPCSAATPLTMTNPLFSVNLLALIRSLSDANNSWLREHLGQDSGEISGHNLAAMALAGLAFDDHAQETDLDNFTDGEAIVAA